MLPDIFLLIIIVLYIYFTAADIYETLRMRRKLSKQRIKGVKRYSSELGEDDPDNEEAEHSFSWVDEDGASYSRAKQVSYANRATVVPTKGAIKTRHDPIADAMTRLGEAPAGDDEASLPIGSSEGRRQLMRQSSFLRRKKKVQMVFQDSDGPGPSARPVAETTEILAGPVAEGIDRDGSDSVGSSQDQEEIANELAEVQRRTKSMTMMRARQGYADADELEEMRKDEANKDRKSAGGKAKKYDGRTTPFWMVWECVLCALMLFCVALWFTYATQIVQNDAFATRWAIRYSYMAICYRL